MTLDELARAAYLVKEIKHAKQNVNQDMQVEVYAYGGWKSTGIPDMAKAIEEIEEIGNRIMRAQAAECIRNMEAELSDLGVTL